MTVPQCSIVIPTYNGRTLLATCLASIERCWPARIALEVIVVDDASTDGTADWLATAYSWVRLVALRPNQGFCGASNAGIAAARGEFIQLLNNDTEVTSGWMEAGLAAFDDPRVGSVAPLILVRSDPARVDSAGDSYCFVGWPFKRGHAEPAQRWVQHASDLVFGASATGAFYRADALRRVGAFDLTFGSYYEDVDLAFRLRWAGYTARFAPACRILHEVSASYDHSRPQLQRRMARNAEVLFWSDLPLPWLVVALVPHLAFLAGQALWRPARGRARPFVLGKRTRFASCTGCQAGGAVSTTSRTRQAPGRISRSRRHDLATCATTCAALGNVRRRSDDRVEKHSVLVMGWDRRRTTREQIMNDSSQKPRPRSGIPMGLIGMVALVLFVESFVSRHKDNLFLEIIPWQWKYTDKLSRDPKVPRAEVVCFGDSLIRSGIAPTILEELTGRSTLNLSLAGGQTPCNYFLLRRLIERGRRPDVVVFETLPKLLELPPDHNQERWHNVLDIEECLDMGWTTRNASLFTGVALARVWPSLRVRWGIRTSILAALHGEDRIHWHYPPAGLVRNVRVNKGAVILEKKSFTPLVDANVDEQLRANWTSHPVNALYLRRLLDLCEANRIVVFWVLPPLHPAVEPVIALNKVNERFDGFIREIAASYPDLTILDGRRSRYSAEAFSDLIHMSCPGATAFSTDVGDAMRRFLSGPSSAGEPRWLQLPEYRELPSKLEDLERSRVIVLDHFRLRR